MADDDDDEDEFDKLPHARKTDPDTSHEAVPKDISKQALKILSSYVRAGRPLLDHNAYVMAGLDTARAKSQRCSDLRQFGYIKRTKDRGTTPSGHTGYYCVLTEAGLAYWRSKVHD